MKRFILTGVLVVAEVCATSFGRPIPAAAGTATANMTVQATVPGVCLISAATFNFGSYDPISAQATSALQVTQNALTVTCTIGDTGVVSLGNGVNSTHATGTTRAMANGAVYLSYELYNNAAFSTVWDAINTVSSAGTGLAVSLPVYGKIPAAQTSASAGTYTDTVVATVNF
ncbi:MAG: spore coat U domain-containing protein [Candidatus Velthaea sp.]